MNMIRIIRIIKLPSFAFSSSFASLFSSLSFAFSLSLASLFLFASSFLFPHRLRLYPHFSLYFQKCHYLIDYLFFQIV
ncbi:hypothetical protein C1646_692338 [Rhizophagus diaphanus]|nr:hypothetical protein C1646_692338 [Rhizophagus diaphanus] [Rhizophagus sp. MUCL 43196]